MDFDRPKYRREPINMVPLINVIFLLLIFFMVTGTIQQKDVFKISPPIFSESIETLQRPAHVFLGADGRIAIEGDIVSAADLDTVFGVYLNERKDETITIKADAAAPANELIMLIQKIESMHVRDVSIVTEIEVSSL